MKNTCARVAERIAGGEPLEALEDHVALCPACGDLTRIPRLIGEVSRARASAVPPPGYASRIAARAISQPPRRSGRTALLGVGLAGALGVGIAAFALSGGAGTSDSDDRRGAAVGAVIEIDAQPPVTASAGTPNAPGSSDADLVGELADITDPDGALSFSADWPAIEEKIAAADVLLGTEESP